MPDFNLHELLKEKKLLIFDFDGTVADTAQLHADAFMMALQQLGVSVDYASIAGLKTLDAMRKLLTDADILLSEPEIAELTKLKQEIVRAKIAETLEPIAGVDEFLRWAKPRYRLAMATSGSRGTVELALNKLGYAGLFDPMICADDVSRAKPDPEIFLSVLSITGMHAKQALVFEDAEAGLQASCRAGIECIDINKNSWLQILGSIRSATLINRYVV